jgi:PPM family protein phosphatase
MSPSAASSQKMSTWTVDSAPRTRVILTSDPDLEPVEHGRPASRRRRMLRAFIALAVLALIGGGLAVGLREAHFVGADETTGHVAVYQGLPIDLFGGIKLYHEVSESTLAYASLDAATRKQLFDHRLRSESDAQAAVRNAERAGP